MPKITNLYKQDIRLPTGHLLKAGKSVQMSHKTLIHPDNHLFLQGKIRAGVVYIGTEKPKPSPKKMWTRKDVAGAKRSELEDLAEIHGVEKDLVKSYNVEELRVFVAKTMFSDL